MDDRIARLESAVEQLQSAVQSLQRRVDLLQAGAAVAPSAAVGAAADMRPRAPGSAATRDQRDPIVVLTLIGRLFLVLAGGFFLRAMTEAGLLAPRVGISIAFAYGMAWLFLADRAGRRQQPFNAAFHALAAAMVAFPLLLEATTRFKVLSVAGSALGIVVLTTGLLTVAWRQRLQVVAWITVLGAAPTSIVLLLKTGVSVPFAFYLIALGVVTLWLGYLRGWTLLRWPAALAADLVVAGATLQTLAPQYVAAPRIALLLQWTLLIAYFASIAFRTLVRAERVSAFEIVQTAAALLVGFGGTLFVAESIGALPTTIGALSVVLGAACYGVTFAVVDRRGGGERNVYYYSTLALAYVLVGLVLVLAPQPLGAVLALLAVLAAALWSRFGRLHTLLHGATYLVAAGIASGAMTYGASALAASPAGSWILPGAVLLVVAAASASCAWLAAARPAPEGGAPASGLRLLVILVCTWAVVGLVTGYLGSVAVRASDGGVDLGSLATVRTGVLAASTLLIAWLGRRARFREWAWLVYPLLVGIGLKMVAQDFKYSRPATLFIALALFGAALILAPRLRKSAEPLHKARRSTRAERK